MKKAKIKNSYCSRIIQQAFREDRVKQDITSRLVIPAKAKGNFIFSARERGVVCGLFLLKEIFRDTGCRIEFYHQDGDRINSGEKIARISGPVKEILARERVALNFLQHLSGIATTVSKLYEIAGNRVKIYDTRKTLPGLRVLEKYAVKCGGGFNHRLNLSESFLIKDNHWHYIADLGELVRKIRRKYPRKIIEVECENKTQIDQAIKAKVDIILLDNFGTKKLRKFIDYIRKKSKILIEVSGRVRFSNIKKIAELFPDRVSCGFITHSAKALDISLEYEK